MQGLHSTLIIGKMHNRSILKTLVISSSPNTDDFFSISRTMLNVRASWTRVFFPKRYCVFNKNRSYSYLRILSISLVSHRSFVSRLIILHSVSNFFTTLEDMCSCFKERSLQAALFAAIWCQYGILTPILRFHRSFNNFSHCRIVACYYF